jgi:class 3 adenylate cyclase
MECLSKRMSAYLPSVVRRYLESCEGVTVPETHSSIVVSMFADVSGFTAMTESLTKRGNSGTYCLGKHLNSYFEQFIKIISSAGERG